MPIELFSFSSTIVVLLILVIYLLIHSIRKPNQFDERQKHIRARAWSHAYFAVLCVVFVDFASSLYHYPIWESGVAAILSICISGAVFYVECTLQDAIIALNAKPVCLLLVFLLNIYTQSMSIRQYLQRGYVFVADGLLQLELTSALALLVTCLICAITLIIHMILDRVQGEG